MSFYITVTGPAFGILHVIASFDDPNSHYVVNEL
jgi:hypothetical protein